MNYRKCSHPAVLCAFLVSALGFAGCKENTIINANVTPTIDNISTFGIGPAFNNNTDTITILSRTVREDSLITSGNNSGLAIIHALGAVNTDPFFGNTTAGVYMQVVPTTTGLDFTTTGITADSAVLILPYAGFTWGDTNNVSTQSYTVYQVTDSFSVDSTYYAFNYKNVAPAAIGTATIQVGGPAGSGSIRDSVSVKSVMRAPHLRIRLTPAFLSSFSSLIAGKGDSTYAGFVRSFRGFYIRPDTTGTLKALPYFRLSGTGATDNYDQGNLLVYTHNSTADSAYSFPFNSTYTAHFNRITRTFSPGSLGDKLINSHQASDTTLLLQGLPGASIDLRFPYIRNLPANVVINKAEIILTRISTEYEDVYFSPDRIYPTGINASGLRYNIADRYPLTDASLQFIDGTRRSVNIGGGISIIQYIVNVPRELQQAILQQKSELHLRINSTQTYPGAYRLVTGGSGRSAYKLSLNIVYSKQSH